jgi:large repetitive protein
LSQGSHTFTVQAKDAAGNTDATPATRSWFVDSVVPKGTISSNGGNASTASRSVTLKLSASDPPVLRRGFHALQERRYHHLV